jgi:peptidoglycan hydrolase-like amidase
MRSATTCLLVLARGCRGSAEDASRQGFRAGDRRQDGRSQRFVSASRAGNGYSVTTVPLDPYVARVLAGEASPDSQPAALEALAIAVRTYALANLRRHRSEGFDVCDQTHVQVVRTATPATERAALATAGQVLLDRGSPAAIYYSASCGGADGDSFGRLARGRRSLLSSFPRRRRMRGLPRLDERDRGGGLEAGVGGGRFPRKSP